MTMHEFLDYWSNTGDCDLKTTPTSMSTPASLGPSTEDVLPRSEVSWSEGLANGERKLLYLKDWHLFK